MDGGSVDGLRYACNFRKYKVTLGSLPLCQYGQLHPEVFHKPPRVADVRLPIGYQQKIGHCGVILAVDEECLKSGVA